MEFGHYWKGDTSFSPQWSEKNAEPELKFFRQLKGSMRGIVRKIKKEGIISLLILMVPYEAYGLVRKNIRTVPFAANPFTIFPQEGIKVRAVRPDIIAKIIAGLTDSATFVRQ